MMSMPLSFAFDSSVSRISPEPPPNSVWNACLKFSLMAVNASWKRVRETTSISVNGLLRIADRIEQVLPLRGQEVLPLLRFLELLQRLRIDRSQALRSCPRTSWYPRSTSFRSCCGSGVAPTFRSESRAIQFFPAGLFQELQLGFACAPDPLRFPNASGAPPQSAVAVLSAFHPPPAARRAARSLPAPVPARSASVRRPVPPAPKPARSSSIFSASRRARCSPSRSISCPMFCRRLPISRICCSRRASAVLEARCRSSSAAKSARNAECSSRTRAASPPTPLPTPAGCCSRAVFSLPALLFFLPHRGQILLALLNGALALPPQPVQIQPRHRNARVCAVRFLGQLAHLMSQRQRIFFTRLLQDRANVPDRAPAARSPASQFFKRFASSPLAPARVRPACGSLRAIHASVPADRSPSCARRSASARDNTGHLQAESTAPDARRLAARAVSASGARKQFESRGSSEGVCWLKPFVKRR